MITQARTFRDIPLKPGTAIQVAYLLYCAWGKDFINDVDHYLAQGVVIAQPNLFGLAKVIEHPERDGEPAWFVRMAVGRLADLLDALPRSPIKWISFCRHKKTGGLDDRIRVYPLTRAHRLSKLKERK